MKKLLFLTAVNIILFALLVPQQAQACGPGAFPKAGKIVTENANLLIIWRYSNRDNQVFRPEAKETTKYPLPGLYPNDGSTIPIWTMPYQEDLRVLPWGEKIYISSERESFVAVAQSGIHMPLAFYQEGKVLKAYSYSDIEARTPKGSVCGYEWFKEVYFHESTGVLVVEHLNGKVLAFSIYTGEPTVVPFYKVDPPILLLLVVASLALAAIWFNERRKMRFRKQKRRNGGINSYLQAKILTDWEHCY
jgi:hypothetical protein